MSLTPGLTSSFICHERLGYILKWYLTTELSWRRLFLLTSSLREKCYRRRHGCLPWPQTDLEGDAGDAGEHTIMVGRSGAEDVLNDPTHQARHEVLWPDSITEGRWWPCEWHPLELHSLPSVWLSTVDLTRGTEPDNREMEFRSGHASRGQSPAVLGFRTGRAILCGLDNQQFETSQK